MSKLTELAQRRTAVLAELDTFDKATEGRELTKYEQERSEALATEARKLGDTIAHHVEAEEREEHLKATADRFSGRGRDAQDHEYRLGAWFADELRAVSGASAVGAAWTPSAQASTVLDHLAASSVFLSSGVVQYRTDRDSVVFPHLKADPSSTWLAEGGTITPSDPDGESLTATPRKVAALTVVSNEVLTDSAPPALETLARSLIRSAALTFDLGAFAGSATPPEIRGLANVVGIQSLAYGAGNGAIPADLDEIADGLAALETYNADPDQAVIVMAPRTWASYRKIVEASGSVRPLLQEDRNAGGVGIRRSIHGVPVFLSSQIATDEDEGTSTGVASSVYLYDRTQVHAILRQDPTVEVSRDAYFASDSAGVRVVFRADVLVPNPKAVVKIAGALA